jgi:hypothetical protein
MPSALRPHPGRRVPGQRHRSPSPSGHPRRSRRQEPDDPDASHGVRANIYSAGARSDRSPVTVCSWCDRCLTPGGVDHPGLPSRALLPGSAAGPGDTGEEPAAATSNTREGTGVLQACAGYYRIGTEPASAGWRWPAGAGWLPRMGCSLAPAVGCWPAHPRGVPGEPYSSGRVRASQRGLPRSGRFAGCSPVRVPGSLPAGGREAAARSWCTARCLLGWCTCCG